jgi:hypothetical protein
MVVAPTLVISALLVLEAVLRNGPRSVEARHVERPSAYAQTAPTTVPVMGKAGERSKPE